MTATMEPSQAGPVLLLTAGMGAGHDGVASELERRLAERGIPSATLDMWELLPLGLGRVITGFYRSMIQNFPWMYEAIYRIWLEPRHNDPGRVSPVVRLAGRRLARRIAADRPVLALSTFHLSSQVLGDMRRRAALDIPVVSVVVDFAAHRLWVNPGVDLHLCLHPAQAQRMAERGATRTAAPGPIVRPEFVGLRWDRGAARRSLGLGDDDRVVLIVAGSWGAGRVTSTVETVAADGRFVPVVVAGSNRRLQRVTGRVAGAVVLGWVDDMDRLLAAADVMVENAGGLTAMEAMAAGTPVVSYQPIPGHGRANVIRMEEAGVSRYARSPAELLALLDELVAGGPLRERLTGAARAAFRSDAADCIQALTRSPGGQRLARAP